LILGKYNVIDDNRLFQIGVGTSDNERKDLIYTTYNGRYETNFTDVIKAQDYYFGDGTSLKQAYLNIINTQNDLGKQSATNTTNIETNKVNISNNKI
jgi:hypothetical protein